MERIEHIATIDFCYWRLEMPCQQLSNTKSNIEGLVDNACGYNEAEEIRKECIMLLEQITESKMAISADYSGDSKFLDKLKKWNGQTVQSNHFRCIICIMFAVLL